MKRMIALACLLISLQVANGAGSGNGDAKFSDRAIRYELTQDGPVSLAVYDLQGRMVRTLLNAEPQTKGAHIVDWDGLNQDGNPLTEGSYGWRLVQSQGIRAEYLMSIGTSVGLKQWSCQHGGPGAVAVDGDSFIMGGGVEGSPNLVKGSFDGKVVWQCGQLAPEGAIDVTLDHGRVFELTGNCSINMVDATTGAWIKRPTGEAVRLTKVWMPVKRFAPISPTKDQSTDGKIKTPARHLEIPLPDGSYALRIKARLSGDCGPKAALGFSANGRWLGANPPLKAGEVQEIVGPLTYGQVSPVAVTDGKLLLDISFSDPNGGQWSVEEMEAFAPAERVDARDGVLTALFPAAHSAAWLDPNTGEVQTLAPLGDTKAQDIALAGKDELLVAAGPDILRIHRGALKPETFITGLADAQRLAVDAKARRIFVFCAGPRQQVLVFDLDGKPVATFGREGGRKLGLYKAEDFLAVSDICGDAKGGFMITEAASAPRRTAHFDADGKLLREWYGGQQFYTFGVPEPDNPNMVWMDSQWGWMMQAEVDYAKRTWRPRACYPWAQELEGGMMGGGKMAQHMYPFRADLKGDGKKELYLWLGYLLLKVDEAAGRLHMVADLGLAGNQDRVPASKLPKPWVDALELIKPGLSEKYERRGYTGFGWADANGDFKMQGSELRLLSPTVHKNGHGFGGGPACKWIDENNFRLFSAYPDAKANYPAYYVRSTEGRTPTGVPIWDWATPNVPGPAVGFRFGECRDLRPDTNGNVYALLNGGGDGYAAGLDPFHSHGANWPGTMVDRTAIIKVNSQGGVLWRVGPHAVLWDTPRGQTHHPNHVAGFARGCVGITDYFINPCHFWTEDGLNVGELFDGRVDDGLPKAAYSWWRADREKGDNADNWNNMALCQYDMAVGGSLVELPTGEVVFLAAGWNNIPTYRVHGLDELRRQQGTIHVAAPAGLATGDGNGLAAEYFGNHDLQGEACLKQTDARIWFDPKHAWPTNAIISKAFSVRWTGHVEARFSEAYTFAAYVKGGVRLWVGNQLVLDQWGEKKSEKYYTTPTRLEAGRKYPIKIEWHSSQPDGEMHLSWQSLTQPIEHIPTAFLSSQHLPVKTVL